MLLFSPPTPNQGLMTSKEIEPGCTSRSDSAMVFIPSDSTNQCCSESSFHRQVFIEVERLQLIFVKDGKDKNQGRRGNNYKTITKTEKGHCKEEREIMQNSKAWLHSKHLALARAHFFSLPSSPSWLPG